MCSLRNSLRWSILRENLNVLVLVAVSYIHLNRYLDSINHCLVYCIHFLQDNVNECGSLQVILVLLQSLFWFLSLSNHTHLEKCRYPTDSWSARSFHSGIQFADAVKWISRVFNPRTLFIIISTIIHGMASYGHWLSFDRILICYVSLLCSHAVCDNWPVNFSI